MLSREEQAGQPDQPDEPDQLGLDLPDLVEESRSREWRPLLKRLAIPVLLVVIIGVICLNNHFNGVDWGDDFALYMRQAKALATGNVGEVISQNRYAIDNSGWHTFSPIGYPWGWPLIVSPFYVLFGLNYGFFKFLEVVAFCGFLLAFYALVRPRTGTLPAIVLLLLVGLSPAYVRGTDTVLSDLPNLCFVGVTLWWMDQCRRRGLLTTARRDLVILGVLLAAAFSIRRESMALVAALAAVHAAILGRRAVRARSARVLLSIDWRKLVLPYAVAGIAVVALQVVLPTDFLPDLPGTGITNASSHVTFYQDAMSEQVGLKEPGAKASLFHSNSTARKALGMIVILAIAGLTLRVLNNLEEDVGIAVYALAATFIMLVSPYQELRYLYTITPFLLYFAYQAIPSIVTSLWPRRRGIVRAGVIVPAVALFGLALINAKDLWHATQYHRDNQYTVNGPETANSQAMFEAVREHTRGDDVILFFRARAMTLYTDRLAIQGSNLDQLLPRVDWYAMEKGSSYSQTDLTDQEAAARGLKKEWENGGWVLWRVPATVRSSSS